MGTRVPSYSLSSALTGAVRRGALSMFSRGFSLADSIWNSPVPGKLSSHVLGNCSAAERMRNTRDRDSPATPVERVRGYGGDIVASVPGGTGGWAGIVQG
ncbi:hypothetical protein VE04_08690 [Pseudogymnoascus sp. 24MN13]|nr:hypothetical protein VE04_08690 [Pseudogymnoascus sp. 24MN13]